MATGRASRFWLPPTEESGRAYTPQLTGADYARIWAAEAEARRFRMPSWREELQGLTMKLDQATRTATVSNLAWFAPAQAARERR
jgi:hypothetical protein